MDFTSPHDLSTLLIARAKEREPNLPDGPAALGRKLARSVEALNMGLTGPRMLIGRRYLDDPELFRAYVLYYLPLQVARALPLMQRLVTGDRAQLSVLDLGCGPGSLLLALLGALTSRRTGLLELCYEGVDQSGLALSFLEGLTSSLAPILADNGLHLTLNLRKGNTLEVKNGGAKDLVFLGHVVNELHTEAKDPVLSRFNWLTTLGERLPEGAHVLIMEPALTGVALELTRLREYLRASSIFRVLSPCTHHDPCPLLGEKAPQKQWCHQEVRYHRPPLIQTVDSLLHLNQVRLAFSHLLLQRGAQDAEPMEGERTLYRALSPCLEEKGWVTVHLCGPEGFRILRTRARGKRSALETFRDIRRGDQVHVKTLVPAALEAPADLSSYELAVTRLDGLARARETPSHEG